MPEMLFKNKRIPVTFADLLNDLDEGLDYFSGVVGIGLLQGFLNILGKALVVLDLLLVIALLGVACLFGKEHGLFFEISFELFQFLLTGLHFDIITLHLLFDLFLGIFTSG